MTDIVERDAANEIVRLRELVNTLTTISNANHDKAMTFGREAARLRALITEWAEAFGVNADSFGGLVRYEKARDALRKEANR